MNERDNMRKLMETIDPLFIEEGASPEQWEIAINNLIDNGDAKFGGGSGWEWVKSELQALLDFQPEG